MKNICYIFGASLEGLPDSFKKEKNDLIIAADGGYDFLAKKNIKPDIVMGDFDSSEMVKESDILIKFPSEKNETDSYLAYLEGKSRGYRTFVFYGCLGGRTDHTLANMQILTKISKEGNKAVFIGSGEVVSALTDSLVSYKKRKHGTISVFSADISEGVTISGLKYEVKNISLTNTFPLGISNEFIDKAAVISVRKGTLIIVENQSEDFSCYL